MISIGVDIEDISRFKNKDEKFLKRIFTGLELDYCFKNSNPASHLCARFCAKEAVIKALCDRTISYSKIEVLKNEDGSVFINILEDKYKNRNFSLSISHEKEKAIAFVLVS